ncbi:MAG: NADH-quinone oxidoreductase subunit K [Candidatus Omnitrophota bacterium]
MSGSIAEFFWVFTVFIAMLAFAGFYCILVTRNLIRALIGLEILNKAVTLLFIVVGYITGRQALVQALVITTIVIEVVIIVVAGGVIMSVYRNDESLDARNLRNLKG